LQPRNSNRPSMNNSNLAESRHLGSLTAANWVSFDFNVSYSSWWGYSLINTFKLKTKNQETEAHTEGKRSRRICRYDRGLEFEASLETSVHASCPWGSALSLRTVQKVLSLRTEQNSNAVTCRCVHVPAAACVEACTRSNTNVLILNNHVVLTRGSIISQVMSSKATKEKALDTGDTHWSGIVEGDVFTATFTDADKVRSRTTPLVKVCVCHIFCCLYTVKNLCCCVW